MGEPQVIGRYEIIEELGRGAMGSVFKARDPAVGRTVALKTIHSMALAGGQSEEYRARFSREARASGVLAHPGIVPVFDVGEDQGTPFLVMEFVEGRTLADALKKRERFTLERVCDIGQQIGEALGYAHRQGVIHRDIKPANILLTSREVYGSERPRITDFGIAKLVASEITTTGQLLGTPSFMPPEQFTGMPIDGRADLFSLGVILYSMATGEQPFPGETMTAVSYKIVYTEPVPPSKLNPAISTRLEAAILKSLAKSPTDRFQTGEELARELAGIRIGTIAAQPSYVPVADGSDMTLGPGQLSASLPPFPAVTTSGLGLPPSQVAVPTPTPRPKRRVNVETIFAVVLLAVAGLSAAGFLIFRHNPPQKQQAVNPPVSNPRTPSVQQPLTSGTPGQPQPQTPSPSTGQPLGSAPASGSPAVGQPKPAVAKPAASAPASSPQTPGASPAGKPGTTPATPAPGSPVPPAAPAVGFDPRKADSNTNAKIKIEIPKLPNGIPFTVTMNKQPYLHFITGDNSSLDNLYVPPGKQSFRISFKSSGQEWDSNIASDDFKAKKKKTFKVGLTLEDKPVQKIAVPIDKQAKLTLAITTTFTDNLPF